MTPKGAMLTHANLSINAQQTAGLNPFGDPAGEVLMGALPFFHVFANTTLLNHAVLTGAGLSTDSGIPDYRGKAGSYRLGHVPIGHDEFMRNESSRRRYWARALVALGARFGVGDARAARAALRGIGAALTPFVARRPMATFDAATDAALRGLALRTSLMMMKGRPYSSKASDMRSMLNPPF